MLAALSGMKNGIYISTNSGTAWSSTNAPDSGWRAIASSADGNKLVVVGVFGIYISTNSGSSWTLINSPFFGASAVASSADGNKLAAIAGNSIYVSTNSGIAWTITSAPATKWVSIASSADGSRLVVVAALLDTFGPLPTVSGLIYSSTDSGATWVSNSAPVQDWTSVASSSDGRKLVAVAGTFNGGGIWTSQSTPVPQMNITPTNGNLALSWIVPSTNFVLQQSSDLGGWTDVTNPPVLNLSNLQNEVTLSPSNSGGFYRLKTP